MTETHSFSSPVSAESLSAKETAGPKPSWLARHSTQLVTGFQVVGASLLVISGIRQKVEQRTLSNVIEIGGAGLGALIPEKAQTKEEVARLDAMSWPKYALTRIGQALNPLHHIRQTVGLATIASGLLSIKAGFHANSRNFGEWIYGLSLTSAGAALMFTLKDSAAWKRFGGIMALNTPFAAIRGYKAYQNSPADNKDWHTGAGMASFLLANATSMFATPKEAVEEAATSEPSFTGRHSPATGDYRQQRATEKLQAESCTASIA